MSDFIPQEVWVRILTRVPAKAVLRFRCVSKSWNSLISSPYFVSLHTHQAFLSKSPIPDDRVLVRSYSKAQRTELYSVHNDNGTFSPDNEAEIGFPFRDLTRFYFRIVGFSNGLLCLSCDRFGYRDVVLLWNPFIKRKVTLPLPRATFENLGPFMCLFGFGFDVKSDDFKVVRIAYSQSRNGYIVPPIVEIFTLSVGNWREINVDLPQNWVIEYFWTQAFVHGKVHWLAYKLNVQREGGKENLIMVFDLSNEVFGELSLPDALAVECPINLCTSVCEDSIAVLHYDWRIFTRGCSIWLMKEYDDVKSWTKMYNVNPPGGLGMVLSFRKDGNILVTAKSGELVSYDPRTQGTKNLGVFGTKASFFVDRYAESLALLIEGEKVLAGLPNAGKLDHSEEDNEGEDEEVEEEESLMDFIMLGYSQSLLRR